MFSFFVFCLSLVLFGLSKVHRITSLWSRYMRWDRSEKGTAMGNAHCNLTWHSGWWFFRWAPLHLFKINSLYFRFMAINQIDWKKKLCLCFIDGYKTPLFEVDGNTYTNNWCLLAINYYALYYFSVHEMVCFSPIHFFVVPFCFALWTCWYHMTVIRLTKRECLSIICQMRKTKLWIAKVNDDSLNLYGKTTKCFSLE